MSTGIKQLTFNDTRDKKKQDKPTKLRIRLQIAVKRKPQAE